MLSVQRLSMLREIANVGSIAGAARVLNISPSAVSQQMALLEREAGVPLLERAGRGVRLTDAGVRLAENAERIFAEIENAEADLASATRGVVGQVRVSAFPSAARSILVPALLDLRTAHPNLRVSTIDLEPEDALPAIKRREIDVILSYEWSVLPSLHDEGIDRERLVTEPVYLILPRNHRLARESGAVSLAELKKADWIVGHASTSMLDVVQAAAARLGFEPRTYFKSMDGQVMLSAVEAGLGVALLPSLILEGCPADVAVREIADLHIERTIWVGIRKGSASMPGIATVLAALRRAAAALDTKFPVET